MKSRIGDKVFVSTPQFEGWAIIKHFFPNEIYPYQVELEAPDSDGHKIKRVAVYEVMEQPFSNKITTTDNSADKNGCQQLSLF